MELEHELDERARETCATAHQHGEARPGELARALEIENAEQGPDVPMSLRLKIESGLVAPRANDDVVLARPADGDDRIGYVRYGEQGLLDARLDVGHLLLQLLDAVRQPSQKLAPRLELG